MMNKEAILHIPLSQYAHGLTAEKVVLRLRAARGDLVTCHLYYGDRACKQNPILFTPQAMELVASTELFDYFEVIVDSPYTRICYYFALCDGQQTILYYNDQFTNHLADERSEYYQLPFNHPADRADPPKWLREAVVYNIFPDSFASGKDVLDGGGKTLQYAGYPVRNKLGGTLRGVICNLDYIQEMGFNCVYLNPIFAAGEYHKYDVLDYLSIDPCFGSNADFAELVDRCHERGMRVIIDGVFNHCSWNFFAFDDVVRNGRASAYYDWFYRLSLPVVKPDNGDDIPTYDCFAYERKMPKLNTANPEVQQYFCNVGSYWAQKYGIDGWRLDVANEVDTGFWRAFRKAVHAVSPECVLIGEVWESAGYWLGGDIFDSTMNYALRVACRDFFARGEVDALGFDSMVTEMRMRYRKQMTGVQLNLLDSHDVPRFLSLCGGDLRRMKLAVLFQMLFIGAPSVFYGDERGVEGLREDDYRKPMPWCERHPLQDFYRAAIALRREHPVVCSGEYKMLCAMRDARLYAFCRYDAHEKLTAVLNAGEAAELPVGLVPENAVILLEESAGHSAIDAWSYKIFCEIL